MKGPELARLVDDALAAGRPVPADLVTLVDTHSDATRSSFHLDMRDGVRVAIDLWLPPGAGARPVTAALRSTRYWRARIGEPIGEYVGSLEVARWTRAGFALLLVDARGTGASFGVWRRPWDDDQLDDLREICDWLVSQPWSNGSVVGYGTSYDGSTAHLLAATGHPAVKAVVPRFALYDSYAHIGFPGGVPHDWFLTAWDAGNWHLDGHPDHASASPALPVVGSVRPVDNDIDGALLEAARADHRDNWALWQANVNAVAREDIVGADGIDVETGTPFGRIEQLRAGRVPMWLWTAWYDGAYAAAALAQLADPRLDVRVTIGPWSHGALYSVASDPLQPAADVQPIPCEQQQLMAGFLCHHATGDAPDPSPRRLRYYTFNDGWHDSDSWPPADVTICELFLHEQGYLAKQPGSGSRTYRVDPSATTGTATRWHTLIGGAPVQYPDRRHEDLKLLAYDGPVLAEPIEITGTASITLNIRADTDDAAVFAYLEAVAPDGTVTYLTEGQLRACHRAVSDSPPPYETFGPWHSYRRADMSPLHADEPAVLAFSLWPVSALIPAQHRVRIALAGADQQLFRRIPASRAPSLTVAGTSSVQLPVRLRTTRTEQA